MYLTSTHIKQMHYYHCEECIDLKQTKTKQNKNETRNGDNWVSPERANLSKSVTVTVKPGHLISLHICHEWIPRIIDTSH